MTQERAQMNQSPNQQVKQVCLTREEWEVVLRRLGRDNNLTHHRGFNISPKDIANQIEKQLEAK